MKLQSIHRFSGIFLIGFIGLHLANHLSSLAGAEVHISLMEILRKGYGNFIIEPLIYLSVVLQMGSGLLLFWRSRKENHSGWSKLQRFSGLYLVFFLTIHSSAILAGRFILQLDTNFYYGAAGLNLFPLLLFFIPYYSLAILSFFSHLAAAHAQKMSLTVLGLSPSVQAKFILGIGGLFTGLIMAGCTGFFSGIPIPEAYQ